MLANIYLKQNELKPTKWNEDLLAQSSAVLIFPAQSHTSPNISLCNFKKKSASKESDFLLDTQLEQNRVKEKALYMVSLVQDTSSLEEQGLDNEQLIFY
jgi:hypothetical protein